ncbi:hypothetical protein M758_9G099400 [Ceratodon purpureus]|nr:hypothetical protein M758_9G099400 [Ceratodon purpureus]
MGFHCPTVCSYRVRILHLHSRLLSPTLGAGSAIRGGGSGAFVNVGSGGVRGICGVGLLGSYGVRAFASQPLGFRVPPLFWSSRALGGRIWASSGEFAENGVSGAPAESDRKALFSNLADDVTKESEAVSGSEGEDYYDSSPSIWEGEDAGSDFVRVTVKPNFDKSGLKYGISTSRSYSSKRPNRFSSRTYIASRETKAAVAHQSIAPDNRQSERRDLKMQNGKNAKRPAPSDLQDGDDRKSKRKKDPAESELRRSLDMCSKFADAMGAIKIYDKVVAEGNLQFNQYNYNVILYLCSSAASGTLKRGKSGTTEKQKGSAQGKQTNPAQDELDGTVATPSDASEEVVLTDEQKQMCLERGFAIYEAMKLQGVPPNEATFTAVARLAVAKEDGDLAFDMVKQMAEAKLSPRLRSYGPALHTFCKSKNIEKAFEVDEHMLAAGVQPEEGELEALLKLTVDAGLEDKVYSLLHRIRTTVRGLSPSTAAVVKQWFESSAGASAGSSKWDTLPNSETLKAAYESRGGGWHGLGWIGRGSWEVKPSVLDASGVCRECGEQLVTIDIDPKETEMFAKSLSELACQREGKNNEFKKFQGWLNRHGPFDVIVDGANVGLFNQNFGDGGFNFHQLNSVVEGIKAKLGSKREPLILLHHRRTRGGPANSSFAIKTLNKWQESHSIYTTPTGSNDDWYWLYAAVLYKCALVTNDEMRDHLFQLLGNDFFPKWKERHQVRFSLSKGGPVFHMPPPYSILIQESVSGSWHIPKSSGDDVSAPGEWLCVTRTGHSNSENLLEEKKLE